MADPKIAQWMQETRKKTGSLRRPKHRFRSVASRDESELCAIAYHILLQVDEMLESGKLRLSDYGDKSKDLYEVFDV